LGSFGEAEVDGSFLISDSVEQTSTTSSREDSGAFENWITPFDKDGGVRAVGGEFRLAMSRGMLSRKEAIVAAKALCGESMELDKNVGVAEFLLFPFVLRFFIGGLPFKGCPPASNCIAVFKSMLERVLKSAATGDSSFIGLL